MNLFKSLFGSLSTTLKIIILNVIIFFISLIIYSSLPGSIDYLALSWNNLVMGRVWTLLTSMFLHANFAHLFFNMFSLYFIGTFAEKIIGKRRFLWFYLISGVFAGLIFALLAGFFGSGLGERLFGSPETLGVGASGAIFGLVGLLTILTPFNKVYLIAGPLIAIVLQAIIGFIFPNLALLGALNIIISIYILISIFAIFSFSRRILRLAVPIEMPFWLLPIIAIIPLIIIGLFVPLPIGNTAHLGGLAAGLIYGLYLRRKYKRKINFLNRHFK